MLDAQTGFVGAESVEAALAAKLRYPSARFIAGGTSLIADQNLGLFEPAGYISLRRIAALNIVEPRPEGLFIGAGCSIAALASDPRIAAFPLLAKAANSMATRQIRSRATVGGNLSIMSPDRTLAPCLLALDAIVHLATSAGEHHIALTDFLSAPQASAEPAQASLLTGVTIPPADGRQIYARIGPRNGASFAIVSVALMVDPARNRVRLGVGGAGPTARRMREAEAFAEAELARQQRADTSGLARAFGGLAAAHCDPPDDTTASSDYRRRAIAIISRRLLERALEGRP